MPRRKHIPKRADESDQKSAAWSMHNLQQPLISDPPEASTAVPPVSPGVPPGPLSPGVPPGPLSPGALLGGATCPDPLTLPGEPPVKRFAFKDSKKKKKLQNQITDEHLKQLLQHCKFHVTVRRDLSKDLVCELGCFCVHLQCAQCEQGCDCPLPDKLPEVAEFWFYHSAETDGNLVYFETRREDSMVVEYYRATTDLPSHLAKCLDNSRFTEIHCAKYSGVTKSLYLTVRLRENAVRELEFSSEAPQHIKGGLTNKRALLAPLVQHYHGSHKPDFDYTDLSFERKQNVFDLYRAVKAVQDRGHSWSLGLNVQHPSLKPTLRPYQCQGVRWMLHREGYGRRGSEQGEEEGEEEGEGGCPSNPPSDRTSVRA